jgi:hypothetical protein
VHAPDEPTELDVARDRQDALVGGLRRGAVVEGEERPGDDLDAEQEEGDPAEVERLGIGRDPDVEQGGDERTEVETALHPAENAARCLVALDLGSHRQPVTM